LLAAEELDPDILPNIFMVLIELSAELAGAAAVVVWPAVVPRKRRNLQVVAGEKLRCPHIYNKSVPNTHGSTQSLDDRSKILEGTNWVPLYSDNEIARLYICRWTSSH
jgi:hypothetical protein